MIAWTVFRLDVYLAHILADNAQADEDATADEPHRHNERRPTGNGCLVHPRMEHVEQYQQGDEDESYPQSQYHAHGLYGERRDAVDGEVEHLRQGIFTLAGKAAHTIVVHLCRVVAQQGHDAAKEEVALVVAQQLFDSPAAHQPIVGMVVHRLRSEALHQPVEQLGCRTLEEGVFAPLPTHPVDNLFLLGVVQVDHLLDDRRVVLQVGIDADKQVVALKGRLHSCHESVLMTGIMGQTDTTHPAVGSMEVFDDAPRAVCRPIVHIDDTALGGYLLPLGHTFQEVRQTAVGLWKHGLLVEARHYDAQSLHL